MIDVKSLRMLYGNFVALDGVSFQAHDKEILGLLGPNGAGKTTAMRIITTYLYPSSGTVTIDGVDILQNPVEVRKKIGYLPETAPLYTDMQTDEYLRFVGEARGIQGNSLIKRLGWVKESCGIAPVWKHTINEISKGYRQRVGLAQALIHDPQVLVLDEPTSGLDPLQIIGIRSLIKELAAEKTIVFSTHILQEVEAIAKRIVIINEGKIVAQGTQEELGNQVRAQGEAKPDMSLEDIFIALLIPKGKKQNVLHN
jgi:ABC-2 type transport system ATP-binding protein